MYEPVGVDFKGDITARNLKKVAIWRDSNPETFQSEVRGNWARGSFRGSDVLDYDTDTGRTMSLFIMSQTQKR